MGRLHPCWGIHVLETDTADAPWTVTERLQKRGAPQCHALRAATRTPANKDLAQIGKLDPLIVGRAYAVYERG